MERDFLNDDQADIAAIRFAVDSGIIHIDTGEIYASGHTETLIGEAIRQYDRKGVFLASKVGRDNLGYDKILHSCKNSLERLGTDYLNLYLLHVYKTDVPLKDSIRALDTLMEEGRIRNMGVCNFTKEHLSEAQSYTKHKIVCNQVHYNLMFRQPETTGLLEYCQNNDIFLSAYRPIERGYFIENTPPILQEMCEKYQKTPSQIAVNWLISQPYVITFSKTRHINHLNENLNALDWHMENGDMENLKEFLPDWQNMPKAIPLQ